MELNNVLSNIDFQGVVDAVYNGIVIIDVNCNIVMYNAAMEKVFKVNKKEALGSNIANIYPTSCLPEILKSGQSRTQTYKLNNMLLTANGRCLYDHTGNKIGAVAIFHYLSEGESIIEHVNKDALVHKTEKIIYRSEQMNQLMDLSFNIRNSNSKVLFLGETGTGKNIFAKFIHDISRRNDKPFVEFNCHAIPNSLLESELFGYEEGTFTGANKKGKAGLFELAQGGSIFLDEIGELNFDLQAKLLKVLDEKKNVPLGGYHPIDLDVRIFAATNASLEERVAIGSFRKDLYYRLNVLPFFIPPLRERKGDIPLLIDHFLDEFNRIYDKSIYLTMDAINILVEYSWPGNIRELKNVLERLVLISCKKEITIDLLPKFLFKNTNRQNSADLAASDQFNYRSILALEDLGPLKEAMEVLEKKIIEEALSKYKTTRSAAKVLKINYSTIARKAKKYNIISLD